MSCLDRQCDFRVNNFFNALKCKTMPTEKSYVFNIHIPQRARNESYEIKSRLFLTRTTIERFTVHQIIEMNRFLSSLAHETYVFCSLALAPIAAADVSCKTLPKKSINKL